MHLIVKVNVISVIKTTSFTEMCYPVNRIGKHSIKSHSRFKTSLYVSFSFSLSTCPFQPTIIFNPLQERNDQGSQGRKHVPRSWTFGVENAFTANANLEETWPSAVHHIPRVRVLKEKGTPFCDKLVSTYRNRGHFLRTCCVEYTWTQYHTTTSSPQVPVRTMDQCYMKPLITGL